MFIHRLLGSNIEQAISCPEPPQRKWEYLFLDMEFLMECHQGLKIYFYSDVYLWKGDSPSFKVKFRNELFLTGGPLM